MGSSGSALARPFLVVALLSGCNGDKEEGPDRSPSSLPSTTERTATTPSARGLARSDEAEMQDLLAQTLRDRGTRAGRPRCTAVRELSHSTTRFSCQAADGTYRIDWEHYGTGAYVISAVDARGRARRIARGTLTISE